MPWQGYFVILSSQAKICVCLSKAIKLDSVRVRGISYPSKHACVFWVCSLDKFCRFVAGS
jgi:hypothetical protein